VFDTYWPMFEERFSKILSTTQEGAQVQKRSSENILEEVLELTRRMDKRVRELEHKENGYQRYVYQPNNEVTFTTFDTPIKSSGEGKLNVIGGFMNKKNGQKPIIVINDNDKNKKENE
jgi:hypothetical protein